MLQPLLGLCAILLVAALCSERRGRIPWRMCVGGLALQFVLAALMLKAPFLRQHQKSATFVDTNSNN